MGTGCSRPGGLDEDEPPPVSVPEVPAEYKPEMEQQVAMFVRRSSMVEDEEGGAALAEALKETVAAADATAWTNAHTTARTTT